MKLKLPWIKAKVKPEPCPPSSLGDTMHLDPTKDVYIKTGSGSFDGINTFTGWPLEKTNVARKPSKSKGEIACKECDGEGWDANSGGGVFICPNCHGTGVEDGNAICVCGHRRYDHYLDTDCNWDYLDLYGSYYRKDGTNPLIHPLRDKEYNINNKPCKCDRFRDSANQQEVLDYLKAVVDTLKSLLDTEQIGTAGFLWMPSLSIPSLKNTIRLLEPYAAQKEEVRSSYENNSRSK